jgi:hypothetical protein
MELDEFIENMSGKPLTDLQKKLLETMGNATATGRTRVCFVGDRFNPAFAINNLIHEDFNKLEDRVMAHVLANPDSYPAQKGKVGFLGTSYTKVWFDDFQQIHADPIPYEDMLLLGRPNRISVSDVEAHQVQMDEMFRTCRGSGKVGLLTQYVKAHFTEKPADHPTRKREPKGPRGRWGKL